MDVISMHQSGVENVVASSGTSLTEGQIRLIHRFTDNVTVIYDSDPAGIKASLRGIDMILAEGINVKVLSLPDGDDPDSFAQSHSAQELEDYLAANETDFIRFKTKILLNDAAGDPIARSRVITDILRTIAVIPDAVTQTIYVAECSRAFDIDEQVLMLQLSKLIAERNETLEKQARQAESRRSIADIQPDIQPEETAPSNVTPTAADTPQDNIVRTHDERTKFLEPSERELLRFVVKYGMMDLCEAEDKDGNPTILKLADYVKYELQKEAVSFTVDAYRRAFDKVIEYGDTTWPSDKKNYLDSLQAEITATETARREELSRENLSVSEIKAREIALTSQLEAEYNEKAADFAQHYIEQRLCSSPDDEIRRIATELVSERHRLSKIHSKFSKVETERDRLVDFVPRAVYELFYSILQYDIKEVWKQLSTTDDPATTRELMQKFSDMKSIEREFAKFLGERIVGARPKIK